jgi:hypothetical protein
MASKPGGASLEEWAAYFTREVEKSVDNDRSKQPSGAGEPDIAALQAFMAQRPGSFRNRRSRECGTGRRSSCMSGSIRK